MKAEKQMLYLGSNLKMYKTISETVSFLTRLAALTRDVDREQLCLFIIPSYTALDAAVKAVHGQIRLGAQNMFWADSGPWTGEISPIMLKDLNLDIVELGHSERRRHFGETDRSVNKKVLAALEHNLTPLICVGETLQEKNHGIQVEKLRQQLKIALYGVPETRIGRIWLAYEPVWAIGEAGIPADPAYAGSMHKVLRDALAELYPGRANLVPILYGGSVNLDNAAHLIQEPEIDGLFIGRAAWQADSFYEIISRVLPLWLEKVKGGPTHEKTH